jgi:hypothetical protein
MTAEGRGGARPMPQHEQDARAYINPAWIAL